MIRLALSSGFLVILRTTWWPASSSRRFGSAGGWWCRVPPAEEALERLLGCGIKIGHRPPPLRLPPLVGGVEEVGVRPQRDARVGVTEATGDGAYTNSLSGESGGREVA